MRCRQFFWKIWKVAECKNVVEESTGHFIVTFYNRTSRFCFPSAECLVLRLEAEKIETRKQHLHCTNSVSQPPHKIHSELLVKDIDSRGRGKSMDLSFRGRFVPSNYSCIYLCCLLLFRICSRRVGRTKLGIPRVLLNLWQVQLVRRKNFHSFTAFFDENLPGKTGSFFRGQSPVNLFRLGNHNRECIWGRPDIWTLLFYMSN